jgi:hypothetical protein
MLGHGDAARHSPSRSRLIAAADAVAAQIDAVMRGNAGAEVVEMPKSAARIRQG